MGYIDRRIEVAEGEGANDRTMKKSGDKKMSAW